MNKEELNLDSEVLNPIKLILENTINKLMRIVLNQSKEAEITLKICLDKHENAQYEGAKITKEWIEPRIEYSITEKIKEYKYTDKNSIGFDFAIEEDEGKNLYISKINKQIDMLESEED